MTGVTLNDISYPKRSKAPCPSNLHRIQQLPWASINKRVFKGERNWVREDDDRTERGREWTTIALFESDLIKCRKIQRFFSYKMFL